MNEYIDRKEILANALKEVGITERGRYVRDTNKNYDRKSMSDDTKNHYKNYR